jgi:hypothetical protein
MIPACESGKGPRDEGEKGRYGIALEADSR